jgi:hypothetical protein
MDVERQMSDVYLVVQGLVWPSARSDQSGSDRFNFGFVFIRVRSWLKTKIGKETVKFW